MWQRPSPVTEQMWLRRAESRRGCGRSKRGPGPRCGRDGPSPGADVAYLCGVLVLLHSGHVGHELRPAHAQLRRLHNRAASSSIDVALPCSIANMLRYDAACCATMQHVALRCHVLSRALKRVAACRTCTAASSSSFESTTENSVSIACASAGGRAGVLARLLACAPAWAHACLVITSRLRLERMRLCCQR